MFAVKFRSELDEPVAREFDALMARLNGLLGSILTEDGSLQSSALVAAQAAVDPQDEEHHWRSGPWTFDDPQNTDQHVAAIRPPDPPAGTYNDYAPQGIDSSVIIEIEPGGDITLTGMKAPSPYRKRIAFFRNRDSSSSITLKHANTASQPQNRFDLPADTDVVVGPHQAFWLYYDIGRAAWTAAITANTSGGLAGAGSSSTGGDVFGPAGATSGNLASFGDGTGKLIADSGFKASDFQTALGAPGTTAGIAAVYAVRLSITGTQLKSLNTSPMDIIAAPAVGSTIQILGMLQEQFLDATTTAFSAATAISLRFATVAADLTVAISTSNPPSGTRYLRWSQTNIGGAVSMGNGVSTSALKVQVRGSTDLTGGTNLSNEQYRVTVFYAIVPALN